MSAQPQIYVYDLPTIPDCTHHRLVSLCGGKVRESVFRAGEHLLRMVANFQDGQIALALRFVFDPETRSGRQNRLHLQLAVKTGMGVSADTVKQLIDSGPLSEFYELCEQKPPGPRTLYPLPHRFGHICEVVRQEERITPLVAKEQNPGRIPAFYYSLSPFEPQEDNDYLLVDALLSRTKLPGVIEMLVCPTDQSAELESQYKYTTRLMSINQYGDDSLESFPPGHFLGDEAAAPQTVLTVSRKRDPMADDIAREHQEFHRSLRQPQLLFHVKAFAMTRENALMLASAVAEAGLGGGKYRLIAYSEADHDSSSGWLDVAHEHSQQMRVCLAAMSPRVWKEPLPAGYRQMARLCRMATVDELKGMIRLPVGGHGSPRCIRKSTDPAADQTGKSILIGDDLESEPPDKRDLEQPSSDLSALFSCPSPANLELRLPLSTVTKHLFVSGVPGSGKTTAVFNMLVQFFRHRVPFLVLEPAKTEYRILKTMQGHSDPSVRDLARQLRIYSPGNDTISPFRFNPLAYPAGVTLDEHIGQVLACFEAAMPLGGPLQALIAEAVEEVYAGRSTEDFPQMTDLLQAARQIMARKGYEGEIKSNLQAAIEVRLGLLTRRAMGRIFGCPHNIPAIAEILEYPTIIEMDYLPQDHACLLTLFVLAALREQIKTDPQRRRKGLHHVTIIEEAHNIVGRTGAAKASEEIADPKAFAAQYVSRMLAELRALGEGIIIADQLPSTVASEVVKNTGTKLAHRLVSNEDREDLGGAMLLGPRETEEIARLSPGEAYFYTEGLYRPRRVRCLNANAYLNLKDYPEPETLTTTLANEEWFIAHRTARALLLRRKISAALDEARLLAGRYQNLREELSNRYQTLRQNGSENDESFGEKTYQDLKEEVIYAQRELDQALAELETRFHLADNTNDGQEVTKATARLAERWRQSGRPNLLELRHEFHRLELEISRSAVTLPGRREP